MPRFHDPVGRDEGGNSEGGSASPPRWLRRGSLVPVDNRESWRIDAG